MDERLEKALEFSKYAATLQTRKDNLKLRLENKLMAKIGQSIFQVSKEDINFLNLCREKKLEGTVLMDSHNNPVIIDNIDEALSLFLDVYIEAHKEYVEKYEELKKARNVKKVTA